MCSLSVALWTPSSCGMFVYRDDMHADKRKLLHYLVNNIIVPHVTFRALRMLCVCVCVCVCVCSIVNVSTSIEHLHISVKRIRPNLLVPNKGTKLQLTCIMHCADILYMRR